MEVEDNSLRFHETHIREEEMKAALVHYRSSHKGGRTFSSMMARFRWLKTPHHLHRLREYEKSQIMKATRIEQLMKIKSILGKK